MSLIPPARRGWFVRVVAQIRRRIHAFILWQQESDGTWRFFGRGSGIDPDADTTACAATVLLEKKAKIVWSTEKSQLDPVMRFRSNEGPFFTFIPRSQKSSGWADGTGQAMAGFDRVVNANVLRYLALAGSEEPEVIESLVAFLENEITHADLLQGTLLYPNPLCFFYAAVRAWRQAHLPGLEELASRFIPLILCLRNKSGDFGSPLSTALAAFTLLDLNYAGPALDQSLPIIQDVAELDHAAYDDSTVYGFISPAFTTALSMVVLARTSLMG